ncbi:MAG: hypothetical protein WBQ17_03380 [Rhizomicrobium sp.]|jgi:hypothetical protein
MKRAAAGLGILMALAATPALCAAPSQMLTVQSSVATRCKMLPPQVTGAGTNFTSAGAGGRLDLTNFVNSSDKTQAVNAQLEFSIVCTGAHSLTVGTQSGGLNDQTAGTPGSGFVTHADYGLSASWDNTTKSLTTNGTAASVDLSQTGPASGNLVIDLNLAAGIGPLQAGDYTDAIIVQLNTAQ